MGYILRAFFWLLIIVVVVALAYIFLNGKARRRHYNDELEEENKILEERDRKSKLAMKEQIKARELLILDNNLWFYHALIDDLSESTRERSNADEVLQSLFDSRNQLLALDVSSLSEDECEAQATAFGSLCKELKIYF
ncbi:MAG TPA: hypothetical protein DCL21_06865 [Alphaproteobacteria bacterium]|nr:hypothetical protein [Alphaproteobacteria bacterium]